MTSRGRSDRTLASSWGRCSLPSIPGCTPNKMGDHNDSTIRNGGLSPPSSRNKFRNQCLSMPPVPSSSSCASYTIGCALHFVVGCPTKELVFYTIRKHCRGYTCMKIHTGNSLAQKTGKSCCRFRPFASPLPKAASICSRGMG